MTKKIFKSIVFVVVITIVASFAAYAAVLYGHFGSIHGVIAIFDNTLPAILVVTVVVIVISLILATRLSRRIVRPLNTLDLDHPLDNDAYDELAPLLSRINQQHQQLDRHIYRLRQKTDEFDQIIASMSEGLILLDSQEKIISINNAAQRIFSIDGSYIGEDLMSLDQSPEMRDCIKKAYGTGRGSTRITREHRDYQVDISRIESQGSFIGAVLLAFDITEQSIAEQRRRDFTANVSHELKTPLQGIIGSADLIENNMVKPEDIPRFTGHIRAEATRMVALIDDIIRLSQLDSGEDMPRESVALLSVINETVSTLKLASEAKDISVNVAGESVSVRGVRRLIYEIIYNLVDNAIKYNYHGGRVDISVSQTYTEAVVSVSDTGIGIPKEHQPRVFERFYRVDKSHSKASGGTGLGLSIVKNAVRYHDAKIDLKSAPDEGTTITVRFKK